MDSTCLLLGPLAPTLPHHTASHPPPPGLMQLHRFWAEAPAPEASLSPAQARSCWCLSSDSFLSSLLRTDCLWGPIPLPACLGTPDQPLHQPLLQRHMSPPQLPSLLSSPAPLPPTLSSAPFPAPDCSTRAARGAPNAGCPPRVLARCSSGLRGPGGGGGGVAQSRVQGRVVSTAAPV